MPSKKDIDYYIKKNKILKQERDTALWLYENLKRCPCPIDHPHDTLIKHSFNMKGKKRIVNLCPCRVDNTLELESDDQRIPPTIKRIE